jgi:hypothetical protein
MARFLFIFLQVAASILSLIAMIPCMIVLFALWIVPGRDYSPSEMFHHCGAFSFGSLPDARFGHSPCALLYHPAPASARAKTQPSDQAMQRTGACSYA